MQNRKEMMDSHLRFYRKMNNITCEELGKMVGVTGQWIGEIERYCITPGLDLAYKLADLFGVDVRDIFWFMGTPAPEKKLALIGKK